MISNSSTYFGIVLWKLHIPANIGLRSMIHTSNESWNNMWLTDEVIFEIYFGKIGEINFLKNNSEIFW